MKKSIFIILGLTVGLLTGLLLFSLQYFKSAKKTAVTEKIESAPAVVVEEKTTWDDQSGFTFDYPKSITLNPHKEDNDNYAHLELTSATHSGSLVVWAKDTTAETLNDWVRINNIKNAIDTTIGGEPARKILGGDEAKKVTLVAIHNGYLYQVDANLIDEDYWNKILDTVSNSFKFKSTEAKDSGNSSVQDNSDNSNSADGEEVIE